MRQRSHPLPRVPVCAGCPAPQPCTHDCPRRLLPPFASPQRLDLSQNYLLECPAWLPAACPLLRHLGLAFNGSQQGNYEDPRPMILTDAVRQLATR